VQATGLDGFRLEGTLEGTPVIVSLRNAG
jgi:hypothetical protein